MSEFREGFSELTQPGGIKMSFTWEEYCQHMAEENRRINLRAPISRLPFEILSNIFCSVKDSYTVTNISVEEDYELFGIPYAENGPDCWMAITHVCHAWRLVALNTPLLWSRIIVSPHHHEWVMDMIRRSRRCPLTIIVDNVKSCLKDPRGVIELRGHIHRCRSLSLRQVSRRHPFYLLTNQHAPLLEYLEIHCHPTRYLPQFVLADACFTASSLRRLSLEDCYVHWGCSLLRGLTHLKLIDIPRINQLPCNIFVGILAEIPALEVLHLNECFSDKFVEEGLTFPIAAPRMEKKTLGRLKFMYLSLSIRQMVLFLYGIMVIPSCRLYLSTWNDDSMPRGVLDLIFAWLRYHYGQINDASSYFRTIRFRMHNEDCRLRGYNKVATFDQLLGPSDKIFEFAYINELELNYLFYEPALRSLFLSLPLCHLQAAALRMENDPHWILTPSKSFFRAVFSSIPTLEELLLKLPIDDFSDSLLPDLNEPTRLPFPALASLILHDPYKGYQETFDSLRRRSALGFQIKQVLISTDTPNTLAAKGFDYFRSPIEQLSDLLTDHSTAQRVFRCNASDSDSSDTDCEYTSTTDDESSEDHDTNSDGDTDNGSQDDENGSAMDEA